VRVSSGCPMRTNVVALALTCSCAIVAALSKIGVLAIVGAADCGLCTIDETPMKIASTGRGAIEI